MVVFVCDGCQESLNRGKVKAHQARCRHCFVLSCVDCGARFEGDAYEKHISCMSESQKYTGKKDSRQDEWTQCVVQAQETIKDAYARKAFESIVNRIGPATVPKKKQKFMNLCKSSQGHLSDATVNQIWDALESARTEAIAVREQAKQAELAKKKALQQSKEEVEDVEVKPVPSEPIEEDVQQLRKKLRKTLKADQVDGVPLKELAQVFGNKKTVKRLIKAFPEQFTLEKTESGKRVKLLHSE